MATVALTKEHVIERILQAQEQIRRFGVRRIALFGAFVRGEARQDSDVDLLVEFEPGQKTFDHFMALSFFLEELLYRSVEIVTTGGQFKGTFYFLRVEKVSKGTI